MVQSFKLALFALSLLIFAQGHASEPAYRFISPFIGYNKVIVGELRRLVHERDRKKHRIVFQSNAALDAVPPMESTPLIPNDEQHVFTAALPEIAEITPSAVSCDIVKYADSSAKYLLKRFKILRAESLNYLDRMDHASGTAFDEIVVQYDAIIAEINELLNLVEAAYPPSFHKYDRLATYTFESSLEVRRQAQSGMVPVGKIDVSKIKFGTDDWIPVFQGIKWIGNIEDEPYAAYSDHKVRIFRQLTPLEACLGDLSVSIVGISSFTKRSPGGAPVIICPSSMAVCDGAFESR